MAAQRVGLLRVILALLALAAVLAALPVRQALAQASEKRLALIIANDTYTSPGLGALPGVRTDVDVMQPALRAAGFEVTLARNVANRDGFQRVVSDFAAKLDAAGPNTVAFVYYTGHGVSDSRRGRNFLIPTTAELRTLADLPLSAMPLDDLLDAVEAADVKIAMIVADACRNTPVALTRGEKGMVPVRNRTDMLVAFSTSPGETAEDNNLYARLLAVELVKPGASTLTAFAATQSAVAQASGRRQRPEFVSGLVEHVLFVPLPPPPVATTPRPAAASADAGSSTARIQDLTTAPASAPAPVASSPTAANLRVELERVLSGYTEAASAGFSPDGKRVVVAGDETATVWDVATGQLLVTLKGHSSPVADASFSPDGKRIVTASWDSTARIWDAASGRSIGVLSGHSGALYSARYSPNGKLIATGASDGSARVWDASSRRTTATLSRGTPYSMLSVRFSPDGRSVATASTDGVASIWDIQSRRLLRTLAGHSNWVNTAEFSPDGSRVVTTSEDGTSRIWETATGKVLLQLRGGGKSASYSRDGARVVIADFMSEILDATTGVEITAFDSHDDWVYSAAFSPDGQRIITASEDGTAKIWRIEQ